jgi:hypothetical protein
MHIKVKNKSMFPKEKKTCFCGKNDFKCSSLLLYTSLCFIQHHTLIGT